LSHRPAAFPSRRSSDRSEARALCKGPMGETRHQVLVPEGNPLRLASRARGQDDAAHPFVVDGAYTVVDERMCCIILTSGSTGEADRKSKRLNSSHSQIS